VQPQKPREIAYRVLRESARSHEYVEQALDTALTSINLATRDRALARELTFGVIRWQSAIDWLIDRKVQRPPQPEALRILLRLGLYQMFWLDRVPDHAAVHETVEMAKRTGLGQSTGFLNAILRGYAREKAATEALLERLKQENPAVGWSHPGWLATRWQQRWGSEATLRLLEWNNQPAHVFARLNTLKATPEALLARWLEEHVEATLGRWDWVEENLVSELREHPPLPALGSFRDGWFYVQDPSTHLAVAVLDPRPGERVLDWCAAPGGKTTHLAQRMENRGVIVAHDITADRLALVEENCRRLGVNCVRTAFTLEATSGSAAETAFDRVLVDAPCSNTGVLRRRVELRWRLREEELARLAAEQRALLQQASAWVKPGGVLVYSTCSLEAEENQAVTAGFLASNPGWVLERERELRPFADGVDGAYCARFLAP
jgi:16S rRNA (cytosine967-C5)-methyltransferase